MCFRELVLCGVVTGTVLAQNSGTRTPVLPAEIPGDVAVVAPRPSAIVQDVDLLGRAGFAKADEAAVTVRIYDRSGRPVAGLTNAGFRLRVNGRMRTASVRGHLEGSVPQAPLVLVVFPPNQMEVRGLGIKQARKYFAGLGEVLKWKVAILDGDGSSTNYTDKRDDVVARLELLDRRRAPFISGAAWLSKAETAVAQMQRYEGPKILLAVNPSFDRSFGTGLAQLGPEALEGVALAAGAHIYIANVGGSGVLVPGGDASTGTDPSQLGPIGFVAAGQMQAVDLDRFAFLASLMRRTARETLGGFANSVEKLGGAIERDVEANYVLEFPLTAADRDIPRLRVEVGVAEAGDRASVVDVSPMGAEVEQRAASQEQMTAMWRATAEPVRSTEFRIAQKVDYFPARGGFSPVLPMSAEVIWIGKGSPPESIQVADYVQNLMLDTPVLRKELTTQQAGGVVDWERDERLLPGKYDWRVVVHDGQGRVLASADRRVSVGLPENASFAASSLMVASGCRDGVSGDGLRRRSIGVGEARTGLMVDPLRTDRCRLVPSATGLFRLGDTARLLMRIYPADKLGKEPPERWSATFVVRSQEGDVEETRSGRFVVDSGGGYVASVEMPLTLAGEKNVSVEVTGPGLKKDFVASRKIVVKQGQGDAAEE